AAGKSMVRTQRTIELSKQRPISRTIGFTSKEFVVTPQTAMSTPAPSREPSRRMGVPFLLLGLTLAVTCIAALRVERAVEEQERSRFADLAQSAYQALAASV